jgi:pyruvate/2-oxoglutarate dehydrogenase complex dihydrolipoamide acyltransferase (E2) component
VKASPVAKRVAADKGVSLAEVTGTGMGGRITKEDVLASAEKPATPAPSAPVALPSALADFAALAVRRLAAENNVRLDEVAQGRPLSTLTRYDVMSYVASRAAGKTVDCSGALSAAAGRSGAGCCAGANCTGACCDDTRDTINSGQADQPTSACSGSSAACGRRGGG